MADEAIANLTHHQNITDAILTNLGESLALQQALIQVPSYDGTNMPLKSFIEDIEAGKLFISEGLMPIYIKSICTKLKGIARDAVRGKTIDNINELNDALRQYFAPKKSYTRYLSEIQSVRMNQNETVFAYFNRLRRISLNALESLKENFPHDKEGVQEKLLDGIALEAFKNGLPDDLTYELSLQNPDTLEDAYKIVSNIEEDLHRIPKNTNYAHYAVNNDQQESSSQKPTQTVQFENLPKRDESSTNNGTGLKIFTRQQTSQPQGQNNLNKASNSYPKPANNQLPYAQYPPMPYPPFYGYPYMHPFFLPYNMPPYPGFNPPYPHLDGRYYNNGPNGRPINYPNSQSNNYPNQRPNNYNSNQPKDNSTNQHLNSQEVRQTDVTTNPSTSSQTRLREIKFLTIEESSNGSIPEDEHQSSQ